MKLWRIGFVLLVGPSFVFAGQGKNGVRGVVRKNLKDVKACYELMLERRDFSGERSGKVVVAWSVDSTGKAINASVIEQKSTLKNAELHSCILEKIKAWEFPKSPEGKTVEITGYPFMFNEGDKK